MGMRWVCSGKTNVERYTEEEVLTESLSQVSKSYKVQIPNTILGNAGRF